MSETQLSLTTATVGAASFQYETYEYKYSWMNEARQSSRYLVDGDTDTEQLNAMRLVLEALANNPDFTFQADDADSLTEIFEEIASELSEEMEVPFIYERNGRTREYTPRSMWEPSGSCEWEESATEYDYGWDL